MKDPAFLFYSGDFLSGTMFMSNEEIGIYIKLLCLQHQQGHLEETDILSMGATQKIIAKFKKDEDGKFFNERLENEISKRKAYSESRRNNRNKGDSSNTCVYLIKDLTNGLIKIGSSNNPERRLVELKNQHKNDNMVLIAYVENVEQKLEKELHDEYKEFNKVNEWYRLDQEKIEKIIENNHMILHMNNHMTNHMNNHMSNHMENENENINININKTVNRVKRKRDSQGKKEEEPKIHFADFVDMTNAEHMQLVGTYGEEFTDQCIKVLDNYKGASGKTYKSDYRAILSWVVKRVEEDNKKAPTAPLNSGNPFFDLLRKEGKM